MVAQQDRSSSSLWRKRASVAVGVLATALLAVLALRPAPPASARRLPDFSLPLLEGSGTLEREELAGKVVVLNFWASWCKPCRQEIPLLQETYERYRDRGVVVVGVNVDDSPRDARRFLRRFDVTYPVVVDASDELADSLGVDFGLPQTFFVGRDGRIAGASASPPPRDGGGGLQITTGAGATLGAVTREELVGRIEALLGEPR